MPHCWYRGPGASQNSYPSQIPWDSSGELGKYPLLRPINPAIDDYNVQALVCTKVIGDPVSNRV